jgi:hypothetical protein
MSRSKDTSEECSVDNVEISGHGVFKENVISRRNSDGAANLLSKI